MLQINQLHVTRGSGAQTHHVYLPKLTLQPGQVMAVTGESGCGKSTLLEATGLLLRPASVEHFMLNDTRQTLDIAALLKSQQQSQLAAIRARQLGFVLQNGGLLPYLTVRDNILLPSQLLNTTPDKKLLDRVITTLKLAPLLAKYPAQLSFGERQRTAFARAVAHHPCLVLADEPTAALDPNNARQLFSLFIDLVRQEGMMALIVCHDWPLVQQFNLPCLKARLSHAETTPGGTYFVL